MPPRLPEHQQPNSNGVDDVPALYSLTAIGAATFLGSVLVGGYMLAANYVALGKRRFATFAIYGSCAVFGFFMFASRQLPPSENVILVINIAQVFVALLAANKLQGGMFKSYEEMGGIYHSMSRAILIGLVPLFFVLVLINIFGLPLIPVQP
jgi:hypothetical protein